MVIPGRELLAGAVEVDESYFDARRPGAAPLVDPPAPDEPGDAEEPQPAPLPA
jgi:hypothetical protein